MNAPRDAHAAPLLEELGLATIEDRRKAHITKIIENCLEERCHPAVTNWFKLNHVSKIEENFQPRTAMGQKSFSYIGPVVYNK